MRVLVGRIGAAHGVKGEVRLSSFTEDPKAIGAYRPLTDAEGARQFEILSLRRLRDGLFVVRFSGVNSRGEAEALNNTELYVPRETLPPPGEEEFYHTDLIGLAVRDCAGVALGRIVNVLNFGGGDILEIAPVQHGETLLVPFTKEVVPIVDLAAGEIIVNPPVEIETDLRA
ncbi:MAG TPA: ribosome maturation factor RimM [Methylovirgula sp.]|nr:ribosome maturation factor RimM [Methylovirgula sp.]